mmetsp:Transcript_15262/g.22843  ORF Transcript_15262/g.22843 Transcript_15262/m.22843 type:complete len:257 (-) Transcript_15262:246-1016(-)|eukprot:CAMPEP_0201552640 /NCGR_PEP_ID=MMETSP0173_2-20130828/16832_1 /ASSEMBLY_ACC=CAM_ASM_000268 /TAXON_ID=218659 /ORGANISM="Vexillifera sp., Strain DIVA3 564/2" /LENGTH=256 /DNA_ID=CAMNT_0047963151 /DNA_START=43 /DNA_END=813 /DNA_ORIENTATION=-
MSASSAAKNSYHRRGATGACKPWRNRDYQVQKKQDQAYVVPNPDKGVSVLLFQQNATHRFFPEIKRKKQPNCFILQQGKLQEHHLILVDESQDYPENHPASKDGFKRHASLQPAREMPEQEFLDAVQSSDLWLPCKMSDQAQPFEEFLGPWKNFEPKTNDRTVIELSCGLYQLAPYFPTEEQVQIADVIVTLAKVSSVSELTLDQSRVAIKVGSWFFPEENEVIGSDDDLDDVHIEVYDFQYALQLLKNNTIFLSH